MCLAPTGSAAVAGRCILNGCVFLLLSLCEDDERSNISSDARVRPPRAGARREEKRLRRERTGSPVSSRVFGWWWSPEWVCNKGGSSEETQKRHTTPGIRWSSPTQLLIWPLQAYLGESGRDPKFSYGSWSCVQSMPKVEARSSRKWETTAGKWDATETTVSDLQKSKSQICSCEVM